MAKGIMPLRSYKPEDALALAILFQRAVREIASRDYTTEQVEAWGGGPVEARAERLAARLGDGRLSLIMTGDDDRPLAFADLEADGHIDFLYAAPEAAGKGIVSALYDTLEQSARNQHIARLYTEASDPARRFFLKKGFTVITRRDFEVNGTPIHNYAMEKRL